MTSDATHAETVAFFQQHNHFGLPAGDVRFFRQGNMPATDAQTGRLLLSAPGQLALSPDGHGGLLSALTAEEREQVSNAIVQALNEIEQIVRPHMGATPR